jgi:uncharacterized membrane protein YkvA (DUF1232 family)
MKLFTGDKLLPYGKDFNPSNFIDSIKKIAIRAGSEIIYKSLLLYSIMINNQVPLSKKTLIAGALGYVLLPIDFIPDFVSAIGFTDDLAAILFVLGIVEEYRTWNIESQAQEAYLET